MLQFNPDYDPFQSTMIPFFMMTVFFIAVWLLAIDGMLYIGSKVCNLLWKPWFFHGWKEMQVLANEKYKGISPIQSSVEALLLPVE